MSQIFSPAFVSKNHEAHAIALGIDADPFDRDNEVGCRVWYDGIYGLAWRASKQTIEVWFGEIIVAYPSPSMDAMVVIFQCDSKQYPAPDNAIILNADGNLRMRLKAPKLLSHIDAAAPGQLLSFQ